MVEIFPAYRKAVSILESSTSIKHLEGARNYINNFFRAYSQPYILKNSPTDIRIPNTVVAHMYEELILMLEDKEETLLKNKDS